MTTLIIKLPSIDSVRLFSQKIARYKFDMDLTNGSERNVIDAKSIVGIFTLDLSHDLKLMAHTDDKNEIEHLKNDLKEFLIERTVTHEST